MFIALAANVAAMAPGTEIGAAHPVKLGAPDSAIDAKVINDTAAFVRAIAEKRHRNGAWVERAVRESASLSAEEAQHQGVVDLVARDTEDLLAQLDGRTLATASDERTLHTTALRLDDRPMLASERVLQVLADPNIAYLLFLLGLLGIVAELYHPGSFVPGTFGAVALVLSLVSFGNLPISWAGVLLILVAVGLFVAELHTGVGALAGCALVALVVGSLLLYSPSAAGRGVSLSPWIVAGMSTLVATFFLVVVRATLRARRLAVRTGIPALTGRSGVATSELTPAGTVRVDSEVWSAESEGGPIHAGEHVRVTGAAGVTLRVTKSPPGT
jgi:membrane-bound serine protease (ClpP class)